MRPLLIAVPLVLATLFARGAEETARTETGKSFWKIAHASETSCWVTHGPWNYVVRLAELGPKSFRAFLAGDEAKKESLAAIPSVTQAKANRYYGWTEDQLKAKWGVPLATLTVKCWPIEEPVPRRPTRTIYTDGRRIDLCERDDWAGTGTFPKFQPYRMLFYEFDDEDRATGFFLYGEHLTVAGGFFKGVPILNPKRKPLPADDPRQLADLRRQQKERTELQSYGRWQIKFHNEWPEIARKWNEEIEAKRHPPEEDFGL